MAISDFAMEYVPSWLKFTAIFSAAFTTTLLCFLLMQGLIATEVKRTPEFNPVQLSAPILPSIEERPRQEVRSRPEPMIPAELPPQPDGIPIPPEDIIVVKAPETNLGSIASIIDQSKPDFEPYAPVSDLIPLYMVQPAYPLRAVMQQIEGHVLINFSVKENGTVLNPVIIASEPRGLFDEAALSAVSKYRFQPRMAGGDPLAVENLRIKFLFQMDRPDSGGNTIPIIGGQLLHDN